MKKYTIFFMFSTLVLMNCQSQGNNNGKQILQEDEHLNIKNLFALDYDRLEHPDPRQLSIIKYVLRNTYENNIHKMRGETENVVYTNEDGREAVYDKNGNLVTNSYNKGSYNYASYENPVEKFLLDIAPWLQWGNTRDDPTSFNERLYYYTLDLNYGIQKYIFEGSKEKLDEVLFNELSEDEKEVYFIFLHLLFNDKYKIKLSDENIERLIKDRDYYYEYFYQIQDILNVKQ